MCVGSGSEKDIEIRLDGKKLSHQYSFVNLGGAVCENWRASETTPRCGYKRLQPLHLVWKFPMGATQNIASILSLRSV